MLMVFRNNTAEAQKYYIWNCLKTQPSTHQAVHAEHTAAKWLSGTIALFVPE
jgi:hypothetical protein